MGANTEYRECCFRPNLCLNATRLGNKLDLSMTLIELLDNIQRLVILFFMLKWCVKTSCQLLHNIGEK